MVSPCGFLQRPRAASVWLLCNVSGNWKLCPGLMTAAVSVHLLAQPYFPGLCSDYFQSVLRRAWALVQPAGHGWRQDVRVPRCGWLGVGVPRLLSHQGRQLAGPAPRLHQRPRLERSHLQWALCTGGDATQSHLLVHPPPRVTRTRRACCVSTCMLDQE